MLVDACCRREAESARKEAAGASAEAEKLQGALREVRGVLAQRRADASAQSTHSAVVQALLAAKAAGEIPAIHGRLGKSTRPFPHCTCCELYQESVQTWKF